MFAELSAMLAQHGLLVVFANVALVQLGLPLPAIPLLIVAGAVTQHGDLSPALVIAAAVAGSLAGDLPWYCAGRRYGYRILGLLCRIAIEPDSCVKQTETRFERWGAPALAFAKFVPGFATVAPPLAGAVRLPLATFAAWSVLGAILWAGAAVVVGALFHRQVDDLLAAFDRLGAVSVPLVAALVALYVLAKWWERYLFVRMMRMVRVTPAELLALHAVPPGPLVLDVRSAMARRLDPRRLPGAVPVDIDTPERHVAGVDPARDIVVYCT